MARHKTKVEYLDLGEEKKEDGDNKLVKYLIALELAIALIQVFMVQILMSISDALSALRSVMPR
jgi:archaellum biogenesis protein FlaJ (TadC family)